MLSRFEGPPASVNPPGVGCGTVKKLVPIDIRSAMDVAVTSVSVLGQATSVRGNGAERVDTAEGAVDRIAEEVLHRLEQEQTLIIWAFDASASLQAERRRLRKHIETVYMHIKQLDHNHLTADKHCCH